MRCSSSPKASAIDARTRFHRTLRPAKKIPFAITNHFSDQRILTGADFDIESMQRARDGLCGSANDNNYPFSLGRHLGTKEPDDSEFILIKLDERLALSERHRNDDGDDEDDKEDD